MTAPPQRRAANSSPRVTVLMPVYNGMPYLREAIDSMLAQTFTDFELLIVNDAATDDSEECIRSYDDPRIRVLTNDRNLGQLRSLNRGLESARAPYVARIDQDDTSHPDRLRQQVAVLDGRPTVDVVGTWGHRIDAAGKRLYRFRPRLDDFGAFVGFLLVEKVPFWHTSAMFRRDVVQAAGGYDPSCDTASDYDLWLRLALQRRSAATVPEYLAAWRTHDGTQSVAKSQELRAHSRSSHQRLVSAYCRAGLETEVGMILRIEDEFWTRCRGRHQLAAALQALHDTLDEMAVALRMSPAEKASFTRVVYRRIGLGARYSSTLMRLPSAAAYGGYYVLSPMLIPGMRPRLSGLVGRLRRLPFLLRASSAAANR